jgi:lysyl-tRNA synthetase, class II
MASLEEIRNIRIEKLKKLEASGVNAYPVHTDRQFAVSEVISSFAKLSKTKKKQYILAGRVMSLRPQGGLIFLHFFDGTDKMQAMLKKGEGIKDEDFDLFFDTVDIGDFVELKGTLFVTKRNEKTIQVSEWKMLAKSLRPLPEKWSGLQDIEERFRRRYLDTLSSPEVRDRFFTRSKIVASVREFYVENGYIEVDLPTLQTVAGGATAAPFTTHHNALDTDFYLTIAQELYLKELLVGGFNKVFEIGKRYRNEGVDTTHNPEFTMLESNESYADAASQREFIEKLFRHVVKKVFGKYSFGYDGSTIDVKKKFTVVTFYDLLRRHALIPHPESITRDEAAITAERLGVKVDKTDSLEKILDNVYKKTARPKLIQPTFIVDYPVSFNPFAKRKEEDKTIIDRFQLVIGGVELVNAFSELNNPIDQKERYLEQDKKGKEGEKEISPSDQEYLEAMEYGMPPNGGIGIGIDRLVMLLTDVKNIKEVILFPTLKPRKEN